jgi:hypothetical protein
MNTVLILGVVCIRAEESTNLHIVPGALEASDERKRADEASDEGNH